MDMSCFNTGVIWAFSTIHSTYVSGMLPKSFSFFYLGVQAAVFWCVL